MKTHSSIEPLEARIAPAAVYPFTDVDGDTVTVKSSKGSSDDLKVLMEFHRVVQGDGYRINEIDFTDVVPAKAGEFANSDITVTVKQGPHGDGHVDLGYIFAGTMPLHSFIAPKASIQRLDCGDGTNAIGALQIASYGTAAPGYFNNGIPDSLGALDGSVGSIKITGDIAYGGIKIFDTGMMMPVAKVGSIFVGGNLQGNASAATAHAGELIVLTGHPGSIKIGGSIIGGSITGDIFGASGNGSGVLAGSASSISIGGDVMGGSATNAGIVFSAPKTFTTHGSVIGGSGMLSGFVEVFKTTSLTIGGNVQGGTNTGAGVVGGDTAKNVTIKGSVIGGVTDTSGMDDTGAGVVEFFGGAVGSNTVSNITIGGNLVAGSITAGSYNFNGSIIVRENLQSLHIGGSVLGTDADRAQILVTGVTPAALDVSFNAIGSITIGGSIEYGIIASGHDDSQPMGKTPATTANLGDAINPDAGIGSVTIGHDFYHSSILAGTNDKDGFGAGRFNGAVNYDTQSVGVASRIARLGPVVIKGALLDDFSATADSGFEAEQIKSITVGGALLFKHVPGVNTLKFFDPNHFVFAQEIAVT